eukprot:276525-Rhodomonas_salina.3
MSPPCESVLQPVSALRLMDTVAFPSAATHPPPSLAEYPLVRLRPSIATVAPVTWKCLFCSRQSRTVSDFPLTPRRVMLRRTDTLHSPTYMPGKRNRVDP